MAAAIMCIPLQALHPYGIHQQEPARRTLEGIDLWHKALEVFAGTVQVERGAVGPQLDEDEVAGSFWSTNSS
ncbi:hypothetical protein A7X94_19440 [Stenotrophomonas maltophilia]|uniref:hypothetical protein n=2 Tax=unclassified Stenotrophomonas TaxID=196198 RepID=UPI000DB53400|nr:hypothetical protein A7X94_19440 [Stenotrophomonas maltophilia]